MTTAPGNIPFFRRGITRLRLVLGIAALLGSCDYFEPVDSGKGTPAAAPPPSAEPASAQAPGAPPQPQPQAPATIEAAPSPADELRTELRELLAAGKHEAVIEKCRGILQPGSGGPAPDPLLQVTLHQFLAQAFALSGKHEESITSAAEAERLAREHLPADSLAVIEAQVLLGNALRGGGRFAEALKILEPARDALTPRQGEGRDAVFLLLATFEPIAESLAGLQRQGAAAKAFASWVNALVGVFGPEDPRAGQGLARTGRYLNEIGRYDDAYQAHEKSLGIFDKALGKDHPLCAAELTALGRLDFEHFLNPSAAYERFTAAIAIYRAKDLAGLPLHPALEGAATTAFLGKDGPPDNILAIAEELAALTPTLFEDPSPELIAAKGILASALSFAGKGEKARPIFDELTTLRRFNPAMTQPDYLGAFAQAAPGLRNANRLNDAEEVLTQHAMALNATLAVHHPKRIAAFLTLADVYYAAGVFNEADRLIASIYETSANRHGADHPRSISLARRLAMTRKQLSDFARAKELFRVTLKSDITRDGADSEKAILSRQGLATCLAELSEFEEAGRLFKENLEHQRKTIGPDHDETLFTEANLAWMLCGNKEFKKAREHCLQTFDRLGGIDSGKSLGRSELLHWLGHAGLALRENDEAANYAQMALDMRLELLGPNRQETIRSRILLARIYFQLARLTEAVNQLNEARAVVRRTVGANSSAMTDISTVYADIHAASGNFNEAGEQFQQTIESTKRLYGEESPRVLDAYTRYASALIDGGKYEDALKYKTIAADLADKIHGPDSIRALCHGAHHAEILAYTDKPDEARSAADEIYKAIGKVRDDSDPDWVFAGYVNVSRVFLALDDFSRAETIIGEAVEFARREEGREPDVVMSLVDLARVLREQNRPEAAERAVREAIALAEDSDTVPESSIAKAYETLGVVHYDLERYEEALEALNTAFEIDRAVLGDEHPRLLKYMEHRSFCFAKLGKSKEAEEELTKIYVLARTIYGEKNAHTDHYRYKLAELHFGEDRWELAGRYFEESLAFREEHFGNRVETAVAATRTAECLRNLSEYPKAAALARRAIAVHVAMGNDLSVEVAELYYLLAELYGKMANPARALEHWEQALNRYDNLGINNERVRQLREGIRNLRSKFKR